MQRRFRLRRAADFDQLRRRGRRWHHPLITMIAGSNDLSHSRFAFAAAKSFGKSNERNRVKRLMRESIRDHLGSIEDGWDILFIARREALDASYSQIDEALQKLLLDANLQNPRANGHFRVVSNI